MPSICPAPVGLRAAFASVDPGPADQDPLVFEIVLALVASDHSDYAAMVIDEDVGEDDSGLVPADRIDGYLGLLMIPCPPDNPRYVALTEAAIAYREEHVPSEAPPI